MRRRYADLDRLSVTLVACLEAHTGNSNAEVKQQALAVFLQELTAALAQRVPVTERRGRKPVHDRQFAKAALLDFAANDPDGMVSQGRLVRELEYRFQSSGHTVPGETWLKSVVREFVDEAAAFELDAALTYHTSPTLQAVFTNPTDFLIFRRSKARANQIWRADPDLRSLYPSPEKLLEAAFHKGFLDHRQEGISDYSGLPHAPEAESSCSNDRRPR